MLADDRLEAFYDNPNALRDYFRDIGLMFLFFFSSRRRHTSSVSAFLLNRSSDLCFRLLFLAIIQTFFLISWFSLLLLQLLRHLFYRHLKLHRQRYILIV